MRKFGMVIVLWSGVCLAVASGASAVELASEQCKKRHMGRSAFQLQPYLSHESRIACDLTKSNTHRVYVQQEKR
jgi:hypothetical protein